MKSHESNPDTSLKRREFFGVAWLGALLLFLGESLAMLFKFIQPVAVKGFGGIVRAGKVDEFLAGSVNLIKSGRFYLNRLEDGSFLALWQRCPHLGCTVPWDEARAGFHCPCHGSEFSIRGEVLGGPAPRPLDVFPVSIREGEVFVDTGNPRQRTQFDPSQTTQA